MQTITRERCWYLLSVCSLLLQSCSLHSHACQLGVHRETGMQATDIIGTMHLHLKHCHQQNQQGLQACSSTANVTTTVQAQALQASLQVVALHMS